MFSDLVRSKDSLSENCSQQFSCKSYAVMKQRIVAAASC